MGRFQVAADTLDALLDASRAEDSTFEVTSGAMQPASTCVNCCYGSCGFGSV